MPPISTTYIWADYFSLWICGEKTWCLLYNHPDAAASQQLSSRDYTVPLDHDTALGIVRRPMSKETVERARKALCKTKEGRDACSHIESMCTECGYDDIFWDVVWRHNYTLQMAVAKADEVRAYLGHGRDLDAV